MSCLLPTWNAVNTSRAKRCRLMTCCQPPFMLRQPVVTLYSLIAHACTIVEPCPQIGSSQISNSDIRLKQVINDTFSDVFSAQWESDCPAARMRSAAMHHCMFLLKMLGNNSRYRCSLWNLMCLSYISPGAKTERLTGITLITKKKHCGWYKYHAQTDGNEAQRPMIDAGMQQFSLKTLKNGERKAAKDGNLNPAWVLLDMDRSCINWALYTDVWWWWCTNVRQTNICWLIHQVSVNVTLNTAGSHAESKVPRLKYKPAWSSKQNLKQVKPNRPPAVEILMLQNKDNFLQDGFSHATYLKQMACQSLLSAWRYCSS